MSWKVTLQAMPRDAIVAVLKEHRRSFGGHVPDGIVDLIVEEIDNLAPNHAKVAVTTYGHMTAGLEGNQDMGGDRNATFAVTGSP